MYVSAVFRMKAECHQMPSAKANLSTLNPYPKFPVGGAIVGGGRTILGQNTSLKQ